MRRRGAHLTSLQKDQIEAAFANGFLAVRISKLARAASLSESTVRLWSHGKHISEQNREAIQAALFAPGAR